MAISLSFGAVYNILELISPLNRIVKQIPFAFNLVKFA